ncbi:bromodomain adjacent to zinc finger domain protein 1A isoform X2 [Plodia interpunctella]|uniref:bromodomain adjacent to zinc finger domain protein 1A isoform X2 n=1 Tax=Plodia interpunctella TaxID=58824 RepID=UPI002368177B|nr:bromodomain adjacent to zinc finger domain protein 1A isoform X2 [Plodia interpunctella]
MPLLKRKAFEKSTASGYLRDDDEVFHCEITDEIFKDYEEYCERIILVNSMVWTCEMTGKNNLTYAEALESEKAARRSLKDFPMELRIPILFLAALTKRCSFAEMSEDVFNFVRERYFVGETVEACLEGDLWKEAHVLSVTAQKQQPGSKEMLPASWYCYEVEQYDEADAASGQIGTAPHDRVRRRKGVYSRDKNRLFLKQFVEMGPGGVIGIKKAAMDKYNISKVTFEHIFTGSAPTFPASKKLLKPSQSPGSASKTKSIKKGSPTKGTQQSMDKFVKKTDKSEVTSKPKLPPNPEAKKSAQELAEKMRRAEDQMRQRKEEEKAKKKEKNARLQAYLKEWQKIKEDLDLEDHKVIPDGTPIEIEGVHQRHIGDFLSVLEFVHTYSDVIKAKDVFHSGLDVETFRKALCVKEHAGVFSDLVQMLLTTIFSLQEDEAEEYNERGGIEESNSDEAMEMDSEVGMTRAVELATRASKWAQTYLGTPLSKLPLDPTTVSEVLRLHLLSSGSVGGARCATWRYQQRGGYSSHDDPGLRLRLRRPDLLRRLRHDHVADLPLDDKMIVLQCLMNQILSYATVRDIIEEKLDELKNLKHALRTLTINERKRLNQVALSGSELKKEYAVKKEEQKLTGEKAKAHEEELKAAIAKLAKESEQKKVEYEKKHKEMQLGLFDYTSYLGMDRAYRRYWVFQSLGGLFVEAGAESRGSCVCVDGDGDRAASSDKENESAANSRSGSPRKAPRQPQLYVCCGRRRVCWPHGTGDHRPQWWVYNTEEQISSLIESLNKRGVRESDLRSALEQELHNLAKHVTKCPMHMLTPTVPTPAASSHSHSTRQRKPPPPALAVPPGGDLSEALELSLRDHILELEEKIFHGCLGSIKVKDRSAWRGTLMLRGYDKQAQYLQWGPGLQYRDDYHLPGGELRLPSDIGEEDVKAIPTNKYRDPGHYLEGPKANGIKPEPREKAPPAPEVIRGLASALLQVEQAIHHKYIRRPLGLDEKERKEREAKNKPLTLDALERWEVSLMESRSFAQIVLQLLALDSSVMWSASILHASCRICRRKTDPDNMLLCDACNKGHHLYCLKPKLTKVPEGDWFCPSCKPKEERTPRRRRKLFSDEELEEVLDDSDAEPEVDTGVCASCGSGGVLSRACAACCARFHAECARVRSVRAPRRWLCDLCLHPPREVRRCAATALSNIHSYTRAQIRNSSDSDDSECNVALVKLKKSSRSSKESSPVLNGSRKSRKSQETTNTSRRSKNSLTNGVHEEGTGKGKRSRAAPLRPRALRRLLTDVMRHRDCWPFYEPVNVDEVPDYLDVISEPMDFTSIKQKLELGQYSADAQLLADAALVLTNCYVYNKDTHPVARAGYRLEKYINKRCSELDLPCLPEIILEGGDEGGASGSSGTKRGASGDEGPRAKRARRQ